MTRFDVLRAVTDVSKFSILLFDILKNHKTPDDVADFLGERLTEKQLQTVMSVADSGNYPLSFDGRQ